MATKTGHVLRALGALSILFVAYLVGRQWNLGEELSHSTEEITVYDLRPVLPQLPVGYQSAAIVLSEEVRQAIIKREPIVLLESTIITHGMPYPENRDTATEVEKIIRDGGAIPATVAIFNGQIHVGLTAEELEVVANAKDARKCSRRDIALSLEQEVVGGTTVSSTIMIGNMLNIPIMVTGGIGGVHRGGERSFDVSADLIELSRTPVAVVSAGVKSILDIPRTLEFLETHGVGVIGYNSTSFPAFFSRTSGVRSPLNLNSTRLVAQTLLRSRRLGIDSGFLVGCPVPEESLDDGELIEDAIQRALSDLGDEQVSGSDITPYVLERVNKLTKGKSLSVNIALIKNNARIGAEIAVEYYALAKAAGLANLPGVAPQALPNQAVSNQAVPMKPGAVDSLKADS